jgi:hypothetical protein
VQWAQGFAALVAAFAIGGLKEMGEPARKAFIVDLADNRDPVKGYNLRAFNFGYLRHLGEMTRIGVDYQFKNRPSFNDDGVNWRFHITWSIEF